MSNWKHVKEFLRLGTDWLTLIGDNWIDSEGNLVEYWRVEKKDSLIVLPIVRDQIVVCKPTFRPGVNLNTLDLPGGRYDKKNTITKSALDILKRELNVEEKHVNSIRQFNHQGFYVNSSFSNQLLYSCIAELSEDCILSEDEAIFYPLTQQGMTRFFNEVQCLQCRNVVHEWLRIKAGN